MKTRNMFKKYLTIFLIVIAVFWIPAEGLGIKILGGRIQDVVVLNNGLGPGEMRGLMVGTFTAQPPALDLDLKGNIYLNDHENLRIQVFSPRGEFLREIKNKLVKNPEEIGPGGDIASDRDGNVYLIDFVHAEENKQEYRRIIKFSPTGRVMKIINSANKKVIGEPWGLATDYFGNLYVTDISKEYILDKNSKLLGEFAVLIRKTFGPPESQVVQKGDSLGRVVFPRDSSLYISNVQDIILGITRDTVKVPEELWKENFYFIGFDLDLNIYFEEERFLYKRPGFFPSTITILHRYRIDKNDFGEKILLETGFVVLDFYDVPDQELHDVADAFIKRYVVNAKGEIYFLHGTINKLYISKIIFDD